MGKHRGPRAMLASINALAAAAVAAAGGSAEAAIIYHPTHGFSLPGSLPLPGNNAISLFSDRNRFSLIDTVSNIQGDEVRLFLAHKSTQVLARGVKFRVAGSTVLVHPLVAVTQKGRTFNMVGTGINSNPAIAARRYRRDSTFGVRYFLAPSGQGVTKPLSGIFFASFVQHSLARSYGTRTGKTSHLLGSPPTSDPRHPAPPATAGNTPCSASMSDR